MILLAAFFGHTNFLLKNIKSGESLLLMVGFFNKKCAQFLINAQTKIVSLFLFLVLNAQPKNSNLKRTLAFQMDCQ
jgi:hypothetical protein